MKEFGLNSAMPMHAIQHLRNCDPRLGEWIDRLGVLQFPTPQAREPYVALLETIAHQQLAGAAARAIWARVLGLFEDGVSSRLGQGTPSSNRPNTRPQIARAAAPASC